MMTEQEIKDIERIFTIVGNAVNDENLNLKGVRGLKKITRTFGTDNNNADGHKYVEFTFSKNLHESDQLRDGDRFWKKNIVNYFISLNTDTINIDVGLNFENKARPIKPLVFNQLSERFTESVDREKFSEEVWEGIPQGKKHHFVKHIPYSPDIKPDDIKDDLILLIEETKEVIDNIIIDIMKGRSGKSGGGNTELDNLDGSDGNNYGPLNQILYGPPGTGKTDSTIEKSLEILGQDSANEDRLKRREENRETFRTLLNDKIYFVTMHPSYSYEDFVQGIKPVTSDKKELLFEPKDGTFKTISALANEHYKNRGEKEGTTVSNKDFLIVCFFLSKFNIRDNKRASLYFEKTTYNETFELLGNRFNMNPNSISNHVDKFDYLASEERKGWPPRNGSQDMLDNSKMWPYNDVYLELKDKTFEEVKVLVKSIDQKVDKKVRKFESNINYVLILDEINRANISKVFGELITLVEEDKRIGNENELSVKLPSGDFFSVPPNLYIVGTMNTADKSIALVDIALRRRFQFIPVYPDPDIIIDFCKSADKEEKRKFMLDLNKILRKDKGVDFQIGHSYFLKENSLAEVINENVIPLLTEYFRNDLSKIKKLLSNLDAPIDEEYFENTGLLRYN